MFVGPAGTGKTIAAQAIADALGLDLYRIDLSKIVSKYVNDTQKNLDRIFDKVERGGLVLLFEEADALFGKRSEVRDAHDRYANIEVDYLLERIEAFAGLTILATNNADLIDKRILDRIRFVVDFGAACVRGADPAKARQMGGE